MVRRLENRYISADLSLFKSKDNEQVVSLTGGRESCCLACRVAGRREQKEALRFDGLFRRLRFLHISVHTAFLWTLSFKLTIILRTVTCTLWRSFDSGVEKRLQWQQLASSLNGRDPLCYLLFYFIRMISSC